MTLSRHYKLRAFPISALIAALVLSSLPSTGSAQSSGGTSQAAPVCMARVSSDGSKLSILLPASDQQAMSAKGFEPEPCNVAFSTSEEREGYRDAVCAMTANWREELQLHFERMRGERPAVLCGMAEVAVSRWNRRGGQ